MRPDRCGVMFEIPFGSDTWIGYVDPKHPDALANDDVLKMIYQINQSGHSVSVVTPDGKNHFSLAPNMTKLGMHNQINKACEEHGVTV